MNPDKFRQGKVYFLCGYETPGWPIPQVQALVYLGKKVAEETSEGNDYLFENPQTYFIDDVTAKDVRTEILSAFQGSGHVTVPDDCIHDIKNYDELMQWLKGLGQSEGADELYWKNNELPV